MPATYRPAKRAKIPGTYDQHIKASTNTHLAGVDWLLLKAQFYQESLLDPRAKSPAGAMGIAQFMPATWRETCDLLGWPQSADPFDPVLSIEAGCHYMRRMRASWAGCEPLDQHKLALASYNAGIGNIRKATREAGSYKADPVLAALPRVTGKHARETQTYVRRVYEWYAQLRNDALLPEESRE